MGALIVAGGFTFLPGRIMNQVFFGGPHPWFGVLVALALVVGIAALLLRMMRESRVSRRVPSAT